MQSSTPVLSPAWEYQTLQAWLRLILTPGVGNATVRRLLTCLGSAEAVFDAPVQTLQACVSATQAMRLHQIPPGLDALVQTTWRWLHTPAPGSAHALITLGDCRYPTALLHIEDPPPMLYMVGPVAWLEHRAPLLDMAHSLAIIGTRNPTVQGAENARQFARTLASMGWCIVSGLAAGVDAAAHEGALDAPSIQSPTAQINAPVTIAVVGTGIDRVYPAKHRVLSHRIAQHGVLLSEFPLGTPPIANNFPKRNRIISGLTCGTLVVEAALASGSLITARLACEQGREVFAIPGSIHTPQSRGCHALIRQGAKLVETAQDVVEELQQFPQPLQATPTLKASPAPSMPAGVLTPTAAIPPAHPLLQALGYDPVGLDALSIRTGWDVAALQAQLLELELDGWVAALPGGLFQRTGIA